MEPFQNTRLRPHSSARSARPTGVAIKVTATPLVSYVFRSVDRSNKPALTPDDLLRPSLNILLLVMPLAYGDVLGFLTISPKPCTSRRAAQFWFYVHVALEKRQPEVVLPPPHQLLEHLDIEFPARFHPAPTTLNFTFSVCMWKATDSTHIEKRILMQACFLSFDPIDCMKHVIPSKTLSIFIS